MLTAAPPDEDCVVHVDIAAGHCVWVVAAPGAGDIRGAAPSVESARRCGSMATALVHAFARIGRRRF